MQERQRKAKRRPVRSAFETVFSDVLQTNDSTSWQDMDSAPLVSTDSDIEMASADFRLTLPPEWYLCL